MNMTVYDGKLEKLHLLEGDYINAGISAATMIPVVGGVATAAKVANKTENYPAPHFFLNSYPPRI